MEEHVFQCTGCESECDVVVRVQDGKIIAEGTNDELMATSPVYQELYQTQLGGGDFDAAE